MVEETSHKSGCLNSEDKSEDSLISFVGSVEKIGENKNATTSAFPLSVVADILMLLSKYIPA